jgi:hypothetical protein
MISTNLRFPEIKLFTRSFLICASSLLNPSSLSILLDLCLLPPQPKLSLVSPTTHSVHLSFPDVSPPPPLAPYKLPPPPPRILILPTIHANTISACRGQLQPMRTHPTPSRSLDSSDYFRFLNVTPLQLAHMRSHMRPSNIDQCVCTNML